MAVRLAQERNVRILSFREIIEAEGSALLADIIKQKEEAEAAGSSKAKKPAPPKGGKAGKNAAADVVELLPPPVYLQDTHVADILRRRLQQPDCLGGCVIEDLYSDLIETPQTAIQGIVAARGSLPLHVALLHMTKSMVDIRELKRKQGVFPT